MGVWRYIAFAGLSYFLAGAPFALAATINLSNDPAHAEQFSFYCPEYKISFERNRHYLPISRACTYSIPSNVRALGHQIVLSLYKGVPGSAELVHQEFVFDGIFFPTLVQVQDFFGFNSYTEDEKFFSTVVSAGPFNGSAYPDLNQFNEAFTNGSTTTPSTAHYIIEWALGPTPVREYDPVVIIPGILGSWEKDGEWALDPITHTYENLINTLLANGYVEGQTLFRFPYNWRNSNVITAQLLSEKIEGIKDICSCSHVDVVAHSMGGLVAAEYVRNSDGKSVDQVFFLGSPMSGAPKAYKMWEGAEMDFGDKRTDIIMRRIFAREARNSGFNDIFDYVRNKPISSIQELLPIYPNYLRTSASSPYLPYPDNYPRNTFLEQLSADYSEKIHDHIRPYVVTGNTGFASTTRGFTVQPSTQLPKWEHGEPVVTHMSKGDGTVPFDSTTYFWGPDKEFLNVDHTRLVSTSSSYVFQTLTNRTPDTVVTKEYGFYDTNFLLLIRDIAPSASDFRALTEVLGALLLDLNPSGKRVLFILLYSPINMEVAAPDGKRIGTDLTTGQVINEIPDALYSGTETEYEFAVVLDPLPGEYKVKTVGTGTGAYTIATSYMDTATTSDALLRGNTVTGQTNESILTLSSTTTYATLKEVGPPPVALTPDTCIQELRLAYEDGWIKKKSVYNALVADCKLLKILFVQLNNTQKPLVRKGILLSIKLTLDHMDWLAKDKSNTKEAVELIIKYTTWFREHKL